MLKLTWRAFLAKYWVWQIHKISRRGLMLMNCIVAVRYLFSHLILPVHHFHPFHFLPVCKLYFYPFVFPARISDLNTQRSTKSSFCWISPGWLLDQNQRKPESDGLVDCAACLKCTGVLLMCGVIYYMLLKSKSLRNDVCVWHLVLWQILTYSHTLSLHESRHIKPSTH